MTVASEKIYLNSHENPKPCSEVIQQMSYGMERLWGSPFSSQCIEGELLSSFQKSYQALCHFVKAGEEDCFFFAHSGEEAIQQVIFSLYVEEIRMGGKDHFILLEGESNSWAQAVRRLEPLGCHLKVAPLTSSGTVDLEKLEALLGPKTALFSLSWANSLTGVIQPLEEIQALCQKKQIPLHVDGSFALGKLIPSSLIGDFFTFSGDPLHGPKSSGALFVKKGRTRDSSLANSREQMFPQGDNIDLSSLSALAVACKIAEEGASQMATQLSSVRDFLEEEVVRLIPGAVVFFANSFRLPNVSVIAFPGVAAETLAYFLGKQGVFASFGGIVCPSLSRLLSSCGYDFFLSSCALSFALSRWTSRSEIERVVSILTTEVQRLKCFSAGLP